ncbi:hypothetical protein T484DRAFT_1622634, partial [Baffinella frigidus]
PKPQTSNPKPQKSSPKPMNPKPMHPKPETQNPKPKPQTTNPKPQTPQRTLPTIHPKPETRSKKQVQAFTRQTNALCQGQSHTLDKPGVRINCTSSQVVQSRVCPTGCGTNPVCPASKPETRK